MHGKREFPFRIVILIAIIAMIVIAIIDLTSSSPDPDITLINASVSEMEGSGTIGQWRTRTEFPDFWVRKPKPMTVRIPSVEFHGLEVLDRIDLPRGARTLVDDADHF